MRASSVWLLVLAHDPSGAKTRLASVLDADARAELATRMLEDVLAAARAIPFARHLVVTESEAVRSVAAAAGFDTLTAPADGMNVAAVTGLEEADRAGAAAALVLSADLPLLSAADLEQLVAASDHADVVVAPDRHGRGTNALLCVPPLVIEPAFGTASLATHRARAAAAGKRIAFVTVPGLAIDVDDPDDLVAVRGR